MKTFGKVLAAAAVVIGAGYIGYRLRNPRRRVIYVEMDEATPAASSEETETASTTAEDVVVEDTPVDAAELDVEVEYRKAFTNLIEFFSSGKAMSKMGMQVQITQGEDFTILGLTRFHRRGNVMGQISLKVTPTTCTYQSKGSYGRRQGSDIDTATELLLCFQYAIDKSQE